MNQITDRNPNDFSFGKSNAYAIGTQVSVIPGCKWRIHSKYTKYLTQTRCRRFQLPLRRPDGQPRVPPLAGRPDHGLSRGPHDGLERPPPPHHSLHAVAPETHLQEQCFKRSPTLNCLRT